MATSKTLAPTNVTISIPAMTDQPDASVFSNCVDKEADAINALNSQLARTVSQATLNSKLTNVDINTVTVSGRVATINIRAQVGTAITGGEVLFDTGDVKFGNSYAFLFDVSENRYGNTGNSKVFGYFSVAGVSAFLTSAIPANTWIHFFATMVLA